MNADGASRGERLIAIQEAIYGDRDSNAEFLPVLNGAAETLGLEPSWNASKLSRLRNGKQIMTLDDAAVIVEIARMYELNALWQDVYWIGFGLSHPETVGGTGATRRGKKTATSGFIPRHGKSDRG